MTRSHTITISVNRKTAEVFDAILDCPKEMMSDAEKDDDGWWSFTTPRGPAKMKFNENKELGILDHLFVDDEARWNVPMRVISNGENSAIIITLFKPDNFSDQLFDERMKEMEKIMENMKQIIEKT